MNNRVAIVSTKYVSDEHVALAQNIIKVVFNMDSYALITTGLQELGSYNVYRAQYDALSILRNLSNLRQVIPAADKVIGLIDDDMYNEGVTFVYGLAWCPGDSAVVSLKRIRSTSNKVTRERLLKIIYHELAHTYGLHHCENDCVLHTAGGNIADVDDKLGGDLCSTCKEELNRRLK